MPTNSAHTDDTADLPTGTTGRSLVTFRPGARAQLMQTLRNVAGMTVASTADFADSVVPTELGSADALVFEHLDVAVVDVDPDQLTAITAAVTDPSSPIYYVEPERWVHAIDERRLDEDYLRGFVAGVNTLATHLLDGSDPRAPLVLPAALADFADTSDLTWGLRAIKAHQSSATGIKVRIAVLDTGFDTSHPDFVGRSLLTASFVPGQDVRDGNGHGTHCVGTACGARQISDQRRYGVASESTILVGKVLDDSGSGRSAWILQGINWAIENRAAVISLSLGSDVAPGESYSPAYEQAAKSALAANALVIAAAGNRGDRPVGSPANCPSVMSVAAVDHRLQRAAFSCIAINPSGGEVNIAAPGVGVSSTAPMPDRYRSLNGTSMATPHVAGCAALWAQTTGLRGLGLWQKLLATARVIDQPIPHVGAGLVQAPV